jgi:hypothetical protein
MTYPWFRIKQARHFNNITFPNKIYNPYKEEGYSMEQFLRANARDPRRPAFLCGGWYHDEKPAHAGGGTPGHSSPLSPRSSLSSLSALSALTLAAEPQVTLDSYFMTLDK